MSARRAINGADRRRYVDVDDVARLGEVHPVPFRSKSCSVDLNTASGEVSVDELAVESSSIH